MKRRDWCKGVPVCLKQIRLDVELAQAKSERVAEFIDLDCRPKNVMIAARLFIIKMNDVVLVLVRLDGFRE